MSQRDQAICLRTTDYSETSQVVHFLTRASGVVRLLAKGTKRPKSKSLGAIDLLSEGDLVFAGAGRGALGTLMEFTEAVSHLDLRRDARRLNTGLFMLEMVAAMLADADPHVEVFDLLHNALARLGHDEAPAPAVLAYFQWRLLRHVGLLGQLRDCVSCGQAILAAEEGRAGMPARENGTVGRPAHANGRVGRLAHAIPGQPSATDSAGKPARPTHATPGDVYFSSAQGGLLCGACESAVAEKHRVDRESLSAIATMLAVEAGSKTAMPDKQAAALSRLLNYHITQQLGKPLKMARHVVP